MKKILLMHILVLFFSNCSAQKDTIIIKEILPVEEEERYKILPYIDVKNYDLSGYNLIEKNPSLITDEQGLFKYKDSGFVSARVTIWLKDIFYNDENSDISTPIYILYGYGSLRGEIVKGKKEGEWKKQISFKDKKGYTLVKTSHYKNGLLDGKYQVFDKEGKVLHPNISKSNNSTETVIDYSIFKEGTGNYYDYYYETGVLKKEGYYLHGKKHNTWFYYNEEGKVTHAEHYIKGVLINDY